MNDVERIQMNSNEKLAQQVVGLESNAKHFVVNGESAEKTFKREAQQRFNQQVDDFVEKMNKHQSHLEEYAKEIQEDFNELEIKAINNYLITKPFDQNPFQRIERTESGIIVDLGGQAPEYKSSETGQWEEEEQMIVVATVVDAGPECKWIKEGDVVIYPKISQTPIPFYKQGFMWLNETRIMAVVNKGLTARFNKK